ncbi:hypothetical protein SGRIM128S_01960 [Streptomyces griseomycini]
MTAALSAHELIARHRSTLDQALEAIRTRAYWSPHPEHPKAYGENGSLDAAAGKARPSTPCSAPASTSASRARTTGWAARRPRTASTWA